MKLHLVGARDRARYADLLERNDRLRHDAPADHRAVDDDARPEATYLLVTDGGDLMAGCRFDRLDGPTLLRAVFPGLVTESLPAPPKLGADWTRFYPRSDRGEGRRSAPESAALFCATMEYALMRGYTFLTAVSCFDLVETAPAMGWRLTPLGSPAVFRERPVLAAWIEVSETALANVRQATGTTAPLLPVGVQHPPDQSFTVSAYN